MSLFGAPPATMGANVCTRCESVYIRQIDVSHARTDVVDIMQNFVNGSLQKLLVELAKPNSPYTLYGPDIDPEVLALNVQPSVIPQNLPREKRMQLLREGTARLQDNIVRTNNEIASFLKNVRIPVFDAHVARSGVVLYVLAGGYRLNYYPAEMAPHALGTDLYLVGIPTTKHVSPLNADYVWFEAKGVECIGSVPRACCSA
jgi:hypothetical protein